MSTSINGTTGIDVSAVSSSAITADRTTDEGTIIDLQKDGSSIGTLGIEGGDLVVDGGSGHVGVRFMAGTLRPRDAGTVSDGGVDLGASNGRFKDLYLSGGVYLGGTGSSNLLDDYEHGFFEPSLLGSVSNPTIVWDTVVGQEGYYVKVGRTVHIQINFRTDSVSGGSGNLYVGNLPFASPGVSGQGGMSAFAVARAQDWAGEAPSSAYINEGTNYIVLEYRSSSTSGTNTSQVSDLGTTGNRNLLCISGTYYVS